MERVGRNVSVDPLSEPASELELRDAMNTLCKGLMGCSELPPGFLLLNILKDTARNSLLSFSKCHSWLRTALGSYRALLAAVL